MLTAAYHIIVIAVAAMAAVYGWRRGLARQTPNVLALAFGIVAARVMAPEIEPALASVQAVSEEPYRSAYVGGTLATGIVYIVVYTIVCTVCGALGRMLKVFGRGLLGALAGSVYALLDRMVWTSIAFNMLLAFQPGCGLERYGDYGDGDVVTSVMVLAPSLLGCDDVTDLWHAARLHDARMISQARDISGSLYGEPCING